MKHTNEKWELERTVGNIYNIETEVEETNGIRTRVVIANVSGKAAAKLIAAAPDMLKQLQDALNLMENTNLRDLELTKDIRSTIKKATK